MQCSQCQRENPTDNAFCGACGSRLSRPCPGCGRDNPPDHAFCGGCGQSLDPGASSRATPSSPRSTTSFAAPSASPPASFCNGRYRVQRFLGEGSRKRVYLALDTRLNREVAVAVIKSEGLDGPGRARVRREAEALGQLGDHPHIVTVHDVVEEDGQIHIVGQYLSGGDLEGALQRAPDNRLELAEVLKIGEQIALALAHAHGQEIVHRDLKPGNIWLDHDGTVKLGDFGLAVALDRSRLSSEGMMVGTVAYMPPEQALGRTPDARSDLYSLGATLYEMSTGRPPFVGDDVVAVISQHINTAPVSPSWHNPNVHPPVEDLILSLLQKDPNARPQSAVHVAAALRSLAALPSRDGSAPAPLETNPLDRLAAGVFVGRDAELHSLRQALDSAMAGRGRIVMLVGEPGIGKTRTAEELATYAQMRGAQLLWGRCYEGEGAPAYWPWVQIVRSYVHDREPKELASEMGPGATDIAEVVSEVRERLPGLPVPPQLEPEQARFRLFDSISIFLRNASRRVPLLLVLDDLHWADRSTLLLLEFFAREIGHSRLLVLGTYRDVELGRKHPLEQTLAELARQQLCDRILLRGLQAEDVARYIGRTAHIDPPQALVDSVYRETEGNPFFITEVVRLLESDGRLRDATSVESWSLAVPQGVRQVLGRRLSALSETCNTVLTLASVIGREFDLDVLTRAWNEDEDLVVKAIDEALASRLIEEDDRARHRYRFSHALVEQTLYEELTGPRRVPLHRRVGEALLAIHGDVPGPQLAAIARHYFRAVQTDSIERSRDYSLRAADWAREHLSYDEAAAHVDRAIQAEELREKADSQRLASLHVDLAELHTLAGDGKNASTIGQKAIRLARECRDAELLGRAVLAAGGAFMVTEMGRVDKTTIANIEEALAAIGPQDSPLRVRLLARLSSEWFFHMGDDSPRRAIAAEAIEMARRIGDPRDLGHALIANVHLFLFEEDLGARVSEAARLLKASGDHGGHQLALAHEFGAALLRGDLASMRRSFELEKKGAKELRTATSAYFVATHEASLAILRGDFEAGKKLSREAFMIGQRAFDENAQQWIMGQLGHIASLTTDRVKPDFPALEAMVERLPHYPVYRAGLVSLHGMAESPEQARQHLDIIAKHDFADLPRDANLIVSAHYLAEGLTLLQDQVYARKLYDTILPYREYGGSVGPGACYLGSAEMPLGRLATILHDYGAAEDHFERARIRESELEARPHVTQIQFDHARMCLQRGAPGDAEHALELLNGVLESARQMGMDRYVRLAVEAKLEAQGIDRGHTNQSIYVVASKVQSHQPDLGPHAAPDGTVTIVFSDMEGFSAMTERLGDRRAHEVVKQHNRIVREQLRAHGGYEVELQGDGFLLAFSSARRGLDCAIAIQRAFEHHRASSHEEPIRVRIGLHTGEAIKDADKFFGKTVILAARIAAEAQGGEILVSNLIKQLTESAGDVRYGATRETILKGISEPQRLHTIEWHD